MKSHWTSPVQTKVGSGFRKPGVIRAALIVSFLVIFFCLAWYLPASPQLSTPREDPQAFQECSYRPVKDGVTHSVVSVYAEPRQEKIGSLEQVDFSFEEGIMGRLSSKLIPPHGNDDAINHEVVIDLLTQMEQERSIMALTPSLCPASGICTSPFGWRDSPFTGKREFHKGMDIASLDTSPVYAPADGIVRSYGRSGTFGNVMEIDHGPGIVTLYGHLLKSAAKIGQHVKKGDKIAYLGDSGRSTGSHLHYEIIVHGVNVNPQRYMLK